MRFATITTITLALALTACGDLVTSSERDVFVLVDASGTYAKTMPVAIQGARLMTMKLDTEDSFSFAQISSCSFSEENVILKATLPSTPSRASLGKQQIFELLNAYGEVFQSTAYTDIRGALKYASFELALSQKDHKYIVIFSDLVEDTAPDCDTRELSLDLTGITVIATNVTKLKSDARDPEAYESRLQDWNDIVTSAGGTWVLAPSIDQVLAQIE